MIAAIGVDVGGTNLRAARVSAEGEVLALERLPTRREGRAVMDDCLRLAAKLMTPDVAGIGIGLPCRVNPPRRQIQAGGYVDLSALDPWDEVRAATGLTPEIENDATMALLGEVAFGAARGLSSVVALTIGTGIGGAILDRGQVLRGRDTAGQLGHLIVNPGGHPCVCGARGCVEAESAGTAFARHLAEHGFPAGTRAETLARSDDPAAKAVLRAWAGPLRLAIDNLTVTLAPEAVVIGGGAGAGMVAALGLVAKGTGDWFDVPVLAAELGDDAGVIGAAASAMRAKVKRAVLVNGVPASGKSGVARALSAETGWPILALDTLKDPFLRELAPVDRPFNRRLGQAAYQAIFGVMAEAPAGSTFILDAWFGFQPEEVLTTGLARAGVSATAEIWCATDPEEIGRRYLARTQNRTPGHPGAEYVPELVALATRAAPSGSRPTLRVDTAVPPDGRALAGWLRETFGS